MPASEAGFIRKDEYFIKEILKGWLYLVGLSALILQIFMKFDL